MLIYTLRRILLGLSVMFATLVITFLIFFMGPSDPAVALCPENKCKPEKLNEIRKSLGLDKPLVVQFSEYFKGLIMGRPITDGGNTVWCSRPCLGYSYRTRREVKEEVFTRFPTTVMLALMAMLLFVTLGVAMGVFAARRMGTAADRFIVGASQVFGAIPYYVIALLFALYFTVLYPILPQSEPRSSGVAPWLLGLIAPAIILGLTTSTSYVRYTRAQMVETLSQDYIRTAKSKGISDNAVVYKHGLRAALTPVATILGLDMAALMSGTLVTEQIFSIDGIGKLAIDSLRFNDLPVIMGTVLVTAALVVTMNFLVDVMYSVLDPRVRLS